MRERRKEFVTQSCGFVLKNAVLDKKNKNVEKKHNFLTSCWKIVRIFVAMYYSLSWFVETKTEMQYTSNKLENNIIQKINIIINLN
jgi:hypothetical protein